MGILPPRPAPCLWKKKKERFSQALSLSLCEACPLVESGPAKRGSKFFFVRYTEKAMRIAKRPPYEAADAFAGHVECRSWNQLGLGLKWWTQEFGGPISDSAMADFNNDGRPEVVYAVVGKTAPVVGQERSYIVAQTLKPAQAAGEAGAP